jgi:hypothetical protein
MKKIYSRTLILKGFSKVFLLQLAARDIEDNDGKESESELEEDSLN